MEHRWCKRWKLELDVRLTSPCGTACVARTRNVGMDGVFVECKPDNLNAPALVHVQLPAAVGISSLEALVVHTCEHGVGLMFCEVDNRDRHLLASFLTEKGPRHTGFTGNIVS